MLSVWLQQVYKEVQEYVPGTGRKVLWELKYFIIE